MGSGGVYRKFKKNTFKKTRNMLLPPMVTEALALLWAATSWAIKFFLLYPFRFALWALVFAVVRGGSGSLGYSTAKKKSNSRCAAGLAPPAAPAGQAFIVHHVALCVAGSPT